MSIGPLSIDQKTESLLEALPYICEYVGRTIVVKVGGSVGDEGTVLDDVVWLKRLGMNPVLVHGGGPQISERLGRLGVETHFVEGRRFTDQQTLDVVHEVLMRINGAFVSYLNGHKVSAWGCNGLDGEMLQARLRDERLGLVGEVEAVNLRPIKSLIEQGYVVVIAPLAAGPDSQPLNVNADTVAGEVARALGAEKMVLFTDVPGVLDGDGGVVPELSRDQVEAMLDDGTIRGGMIPKIQACLRALDAVPRVHVLDGRVPHALIRELFTHEGVGTMLTSEPRPQGSPRMTTTSVRPRTSADWIAVEQATFFANRRAPLVIERGQGSRVWDVEGRAYLDMIAGIAVVSLGHCSPVVQRALAEQSARLIHISNLYYSIPQLQLAELLTEHSPFDRVFFANSGAEANEAALKLARKFGKRHRNGAYAVITAEHGFHGRTLATVTATGKEAYTRPFTPLPEGFVHVPFNDMDALERAVDATTAAVLIEPIQGEGGVHVATRTYLRDVQDFCRDQNLLFMVDEVQTGVGRLGTLWGFERWGVEPDIMTLAKGLGGGVPIGAVLARESAAVFEPGDHGSTFGGNPLMCAVAFAVVSYILENDVLGNVNRVGGVLKEGLERLATEQPLIESVRGEGLLLAVDLRAERAPDVVRLGIEEGVLLNATGPTTIRMAPPLTLSQAEAEEALEKFKRALARLEAPEVTQPAAG